MTTTIDSEKKIQQLTHKLYRSDDLKVGDLVRFSKQTDEQPVQWYRIVSEIRGNFMAKKCVERPEQDTEHAASAGDNDTFRSFRFDQVVEVKTKRQAY